MTTSAPDGAFAHSVSALMVRQVEAIDAWNTAREHRERALSAMAVSREAILDAARRRAVLHCTTEAIIAHTAQWLNRDAEPMARTAPLRAVVAHRQSWFATKVAAALAERDISVVAITDSGAEALGAVVAEQPDLIVLEERLAMIGGEHLVAEIALFAPSTISAVQMSYGDRAQAMLDAGAQIALSRQVRAEPFADQAATLVQAARRAALTPVPTVA